jgi:HlyD family secretion protein
MKTRSIIMAVGVLAVAGAAFTYRDRLLPGANSALVTKKVAPAKEQQAISVTVTRAKIGELVETAFVNGTLVARDEILVGPELEGLRVTEVLAEEGDRVKKGQVLARLVSDTMEAQMAQNEATLARATAAIAQARSNIASAEARLVEAKNALERGTSLGKSGVISESALDQRQSAARTAEASLAASRDAQRVAEAEKAQIEAQRRELTWRQSRTAIMAPADGVISRRLARVGAFAAGAQDAMFRIIADGEIELDAEVPETILAHIKPGQRTEVSVAGVDAVNGKIRLVSPEIDRTTRLGRVRISLGTDPGLRLGAFGRGRVETARVQGVTLPVSAVMHSGDGSFVQVVRGDRITTTRVDIGITANGRVEIKSGIGDGEIVVAKSGTFLRDGDVIRPVSEEPAETVKVN